MRRWRLVGLLVGAVTAAVTGAGVTDAGASAPRARGDVRVLAQVGAPGYPAFPLVVGDRIYEGTYDNPYGDPAPSKVFAYSATGTLLRTYEVTGQDTSKAHGVQVATRDYRGRLLLLDKTSGRIIRLDPATGRQTLYSTIPDIPVCSAAPPDAPCSPATVDQAPMPDYAAWGTDGSLFVTDYQQAAIWRVPPGGGAPVIFFASPQLDGGPFGTACILLMPDHHTLLFDQASNGGQPSAPGAQNGTLYTLAILPGDRPGTPRAIWSSGPADAPDGCALATSGHIYIALVGVSNQIVELDGAGHELSRFGAQYTGANDSNVPYDSPSGVSFLGTSLIVANQSYFANSSANQVLLDVAAGETGVPAYVPRYAGELAPKVPARPKPRRRHRKAKPHANHRPPHRPARSVRR